MFSIARLDDYVARGLLSAKHANGLVIYNYTDRCTFDRSWDEVTLHCRGLILDASTGDVVANPWPKFFNHNEPDAPRIDPPPDEVTVKHDGALGIGYRDGTGAQRWATRGRFDSPQAQIAETLWQSGTGHRPFPPDITPLVEIIHPDTKVIVEYDVSELILLGARTLSGRDLPYTEVARLAEAHGLRHVERVDLGVEELRARTETMDHTAEGFVARFGDHRCKFKSAAYLTLARLIQGMTERRVADLWYARTPLPPQVPEETRVWAEALMVELDEHTREEGRQFDARFEEISGRVDDGDRKAFAMAAREHGDWMKALMNRYVGRPVDLRLRVYRMRFQGNRPRS